MITEGTILDAVRLLQQAAPGSTVILFGSCARGDLTADSDLDFLVVEPAVKSRRTEMVRLSLALRSLKVPVDVLVVSREAFASLRQIPGTVYYWADREGRRFDVAA